MSLWTLEIANSPEALESFATDLVLTVQEQENDTRHVPLERARTQALTNNSSCFVEERNFALCFKLCKEECFQIALLDQHHPSKTYCEPNMFIY